MTVSSVGERAALWFFFADFDSERRARELIGKELFIEEEEGADDEFYFEDLIGFEVRIGRKRGKITDLYDHDYNPLFEIEIDGRRVLVPAVEEVHCPDRLRERVS